MKRATLRTFLGMITLSTALSFTGCSKPKPVKNTLEFNYEKDIVDGKISQDDLLNHVYAVTYERDGEQDVKLLIKEDKREEIRIDDDDHPFVEVSHIDHVKYYDLQNGKVFISYDEQAKNITYEVGEDITILAESKLNKFLKERYFDQEDYNIEYLIAFFNQNKDYFAIKEEQAMVMADVYTIERPKQEEDSKYIGIDWNIVHRALVSKSTNDIVYRNNDDLSKIESLDLNRNTLKRLKQSIESEGIIMNDEEFLCYLSEVVSNCPSLNTITIEEDYGFESSNKPHQEWLISNLLYNIANCERLTDLKLSNLPIRDLKPLKSAKNLCYLNIFDCRLTDLTGLSEIKSLAILFLNDNYVEDISEVAGLTNLQTLNISYSNVSDLTPVSSLRKLEHFSAVNCPIYDITSLKRCSKLNQININGTGVYDLTPLKSLYYIKELDISKCPIDDYSPLYNMYIPSVTIGGLDEKPVMQMKSWYVPEFLKIEDGNWEAFLQKYQDIILIEGAIDSYALIDDINKLELKA